MKTTLVKTFVLSLACLCAMPAWADRVKDLVTVAAQLPNQLIVFVLVVG